MATKEFSGGCLCGAVRYAIHGVIGPIGHCHCHTCRKSQAAAFATTGRVAWSDFTWTQGEEMLRRHASSPGKRRTFCGRCGSHLLAAWDGEEELILRLGSLFDDPGHRPLLHIWTGESAPWYVIPEGLPCYEGRYVAPDGSASLPTPRTDDFRLRFERRTSQQCSCDRRISGGAVRGGLTANRGVPR